jgi:hypothetical protein
LVAGHVGVDLIATARGIGESRDSSTFARIVGPPVDPPWQKKKRIDRGYVMLKPMKLLII